MVVAVTKAASASSGSASGTSANSFFPGLGKKSRVATRIWTLANAPVAVSGSSGGSLTFHVMTDLEAQCDAVRFIFANYKATAENIAAARCYLASATDGVHVPQVADAAFSGAGSQVITFNGVANAVIPASPGNDADGVILPSFLLSDWLQYSSPDRTDNPGHNRPILHVRHEISGLTETTGQVNGIQPVPANSTDWYGGNAFFGYPDVNGRWIQCNRNGGSKVATAFGQTPVTFGSSGALLGIQYRARSGYVFTISATGDSITAGAGASNDAAHGYRTWLLQAQQTLSAAATPTEYILAGFSGKHTWGYLAQFKNLINNTDIRPTLALFAAYSPNDGPGNISTSRGNAIAFAAFCEGNSILPGFWTGLPTDYTTNGWGAYDSTKSYNTQALDAARQAYNVSMSSFGVPFVSDFNSVVAVNGLDSTGAGTAQIFNNSFTVGATGAGLHPNYAGDQALAAKLVTDLQAGPFGSYWK